MLTEGLLWFDDDPRRSLHLKIADALVRYSERTGWQPTICETHPAQAEAFNAEVTGAATRRRRAKASAAPTPALPPKLRVLPNASLRPNYFLVGIAAGERPRKAASQHARTTQRRNARAAATPPAPTSEPLRTPAHARAAKPRAKAS